MTKLSDEAKKAIGKISPALLATASKTGKPNVSAKGSLRVLDDEHVVFADIASPRTVANIRENPQVAVICLDAAARTGCRGPWRRTNPDARAERGGLERHARKLSESWDHRFPGFPQHYFPFTSFRGEYYRGKRDEYLKSIIVQLLTAHFDGYGTIVYPNVA